MKRKLRTFILVITHVLAAIENSAFGMDNAAWENSETSWEDFDYDFIFENNQYSTNILPLGCVASWGERFVNVTWHSEKYYDSNQTPATCVKKCFERNPELNVVFLRGAECECSQLMYLPSISNWSVRKELCNIPCPVKEFNYNGNLGQRPTKYLKHNMCGGNQAYSVYCKLDPKIDWKKTIKSLLSTMHATTVTTTSRQVRNNYKDISPKFAIEESCAVCDNSKNISCRQPYSPADFDYFPTNSPETCTKYCRGIRTSTISMDMETNSTHYTSNVTSVVEFPSSYALMTWWKEENGYIPICRCLDQCDRTMFTPVDSTFCQMACPGRLDATCGGLQTGEFIYSTIYCANIADKNCKLHSSEKPCNNKTCQKIDPYGYNWKACGNITKTTSCSNLLANSTGQAYWYCSGDGEFDTLQPDVSNCTWLGTGSWLGTWLMGMNEIKIEDAASRMKELEEICRDAQRPNSSHTYLGHQIYNIAFLADVMLSKVSEQKNSSQLYPVIQSAVNINTLLIQQSTPWESLPNQEKSSISTYVMESIESAMFNLTKKHTGHDFRKNFTPGNDTDDKFEFLIFAETFNKTKAATKNSSYEFPAPEERSGQDSFIKLPFGWEDQVNSEDIQIAAMSIDAKYVSYTRPGQFQELASSSDLVGRGDFQNKLINSKQISISVASSVGKRSNFPTKTFSVQTITITFYHDNEAWGDGRQEIPRTLYDLEKPNAVLGSAQCVFWDKMNSSWSTDGCHIDLVRSNRFQTICKCPQSLIHQGLASFAVLMDVHRYVGKERGLGILTVILCPLSEIALLLTIISLHFAFKKFQRKPSNHLQKKMATAWKNLAGCLFIGHGMVLFVLDRNYFYMNDIVCIGAALLTHYIFLCAFMWMFVGGLHLYRLIGADSETMLHSTTGRSRLKYKYIALSAYGSPMLVIMITFMTGHLQGSRPYGGDVYCWLEGSYIYSFLVPIALIVLVNLILLSFVWKGSYQYLNLQKKNPNKSGGKVISLRLWLRSCLLLTFGLGITWIFGFFTLIKAPGGIIAAYMFTILNASQGIFIFMVSCIYNVTVRAFLVTKLSKYFPLCILSSASSNFKLDGKPKRPLVPVKSDSTTSTLESEKSQEPLIRELKTRLFAIEGDMTLVNERPLKWKTEMGA